jgi:hypothetical protein
MMLDFERTTIQTKLTIHRSSDFLRRKIVSQGISTQQSEARLDLSAMKRQWVPRAIRQCYQQSKDDRDANNHI